MSEARKTALYDEHIKAGAKVIDFHGWMLPIWYQGALDEHRQVRTACGLFDVSHMGEIRVSGPQAEKFLQHITINDVTRLKDLSGQYTAILNEKGGMIDDLIVYRLKENEFFICANAANREKDFAWIAQQSKAFDVKVSDESDNWSQIAIQGPNSRTVVKSLLPAEYADSFDKLEYTKCMHLIWQGQACLLARTGYTGELGFELYIPNNLAAAAWQKLLATGEALVKPVGLGARDSLRTEACYLLYGNDMDDGVTPLEAGIEWATKLDKGSFIGRDALVRQKEAGVPRKLVAFKMTEGGIPRSHMDVYCQEQKIGHVTSGSVLPSLDAVGGLVLIDAKFANIDQEISIDIRGKRKLALIVKKPLYSAKVKT